MGFARFTLHVVATRDGLIARARGHSPATWASAEEQAAFAAAVEAADWGIMGRGTHEAAFKRARRRIVFSRAAATPQWRSSHHLWLDPEALRPEDLAALVAPRRRLSQGLILGGTAVHDWFHRHGRIDAVELAIEPTIFGDGLPIFGDQQARDPLEAFVEKGYRAQRMRTLNASGTRLVSMTRG